MIKQIGETLLPITEFRHKMTQVLDELVAPKVLMNRDKPQAVLVPYEQYLAMEQALEDHLDDILVRLAQDRVSESEAKYIAHDVFWKGIGIE